MSQLSYLIISFKIKDRKKILSTKKKPFPSWKLVLKNLNKLKRGINVGKAKKKCISTLLLNLIYKELYSSIYEQTRNENSAISSPCVDRGIAFALPRQH